MRKRERERESGEFLINIYVANPLFQLGAGCGLAGFIAAQFSKFTAITDGNEVIAIQPFDTS